MRQEAQKGFDEDRRGFQHDREKIKPEDMKRFIERSMLKFLILFISLFEFIKKGVGNRYNCKKNCLDRCNHGLIAGCIFNVDFAGQFLMPESGNRKSLSLFLQ